MKRFLRSLTTISFVLVFLLCIVSAVRSAPRWNVPQKLVQPDGSTVRCFASGDEFNHWLHDKDNYTIIQHPATGYFVYALLENDILVPSSYVVGKVNPASVGLTKGVHISIKEMTRRRETVLKRTSGTLSKTSFAGSLNNLVIFIRFADEEKSVFPDSTARFDRLFNSNAAGVNSMFNYFHEVSYGKAAISTTFYPLAADSVLSYKDTQPRNYYRRYNSVTNPIGFTTDAIAWTREKSLLINAVNMVASQIPPELNIDVNGDGNVDDVCFIVSGDVDAWTELLWPHAWMLPLNSAIINGKQVRDFNFQLRDDLLTSPKYDGVASLSHEMFHTLGAPDLYQYTNHLSPDEVWPVWKWDIMGYVGSTPPQHMGAYMKYKYGGWINSIPTIEAPGTYTLSPLTSATNSCYKIPSAFSSTEFFVVEYRKKSGAFESSLPDEGLLVYRINTAVTGNSNGPPDEVYVYRPGGFLALNGTPDNAAYSANSGRESFNDYTNPSCFLSNGSIGGLNISNVGFLGDTITFTLGTPIENAGKATHTQGFGDGTVSILIADASQTTDHTYRMIIDDSSFSYKIYSVRDMTLGGMVKVQNANQFDGVTHGPLFDGLWLVVSDVTKIGIDIKNTKWIIGSSTLKGVPYLYNGVIGSTTVTARALPYDYTITLFNTVMDTSVDIYEVPATFMKFQVRNITKNRNAKVVFIDGDGDNTISSMDELHIMEPDSTGTLKLTWGIAFYPAVPDIQPVAGDQFFLKTLKPLTSDDVYEFTLKPASVAFNASPTGFYLMQNYPNPFNPVTNVEFRMKNEGKVKLSVFDLLGRKVAELVNEQKPAGRYEVTWDASKFSSGVYFYKFTAGGFSQTRRMLLLK